MKVEALSEPVLCVVHTCFSPEAFSCHCMGRAAATPPRHRRGIAGFACSFGGAERASSAAACMSCAPTVEGNCCGLFTGPGAWSDRSSSSVHTDTVHASGGSLKCSSHVRYRETVLTRARARAIAIKSDQNSGRRYVLSHKTGGEFYVRCTSPLAPLGLI